MGIPEATETRAAAHAAHTGSGTIAAPEKCRWPHGAEAAATLMIDDLSCGYLNQYGRGWNASCDWGAGCGRDGSIFAYFRRELLSRFPEIRYTVFLPFGKHSIGMVPTGYDHACAEPFQEPEFIELLLGIQSTGNELAYHGHHHGLLAPTLDPSTWSGEYRDHSPEGYKAVIREDVEKAARSHGIRIKGGKFPGYRYDPGLEKAVEELGFDWWSFDYDAARANPGYRGRVVDLPANMTGGHFNRSGRAVRDLAAGFIRERRLERRIREGGVIAIQEHFLSTRPDGRRQTPNIFDDIESLARIYGVLRGADIWHATCSGIAAYARAFDGTALHALPGGFRIESAGGDGISIRAGAGSLRERATGKTLPGAFKRGSWIYNGMGPGEYGYL
jgi:hypothetical protein